MEGSKLHIGSVIWDATTGQEQGQIVHENSTSITNKVLKSGDAITGNLTISGNVGIGTTSPGEKLHISNSSVGTVALQLSTTQNSLGTFGRLQWRNTFGASSYPISSAAIDSAIGSLGAAPYLSFYTSNTTLLGGSLFERMRITNNGSVGIGTSSPTSKLSVSGNNGLNLSGATPTNVAFQISNVDTNYGMLFGTIESGQGFIQQRRTDTSETYYNLHIQPHGGKVAIGTGLTTPDAQLQVKSGATDRIPLILDTVASHTARLAEFKSNNVVKAYLANDGRFQGVGISNITYNNAFIETANTGLNIGRNAADANPALIINLANSGATSDITRFQKAAATLASVENDGSINTSAKFKYGTNAYTEYNATDNTIDFVFGE
jgi:hypothetical protein